MPVVIKPLGGPLEPASPHFNPVLNAHELRYALEYSSGHGGLLPTDRFWSNLEWRFAKAPVRFGHYHPRIVGLLERNAEAERAIVMNLSRSAPAARSGQASPGPLAPGGPSDATAGIPPFEPRVILSSVPEPSPMVLMGVLLTVLVAFPRLAAMARGRAERRGGPRGG